MEKFSDLLKRVYRYRVAKKVLNFITWLIALALFVVLYILVQ